MATLRKDGLYQARRTANGRKVYGYGRTEREAEAEAERKQLQNLGVAGLQSTPSLNEFVEMIYAPTVKHASPKWKAQIQWALKHVLPILGEKPIDEVTRSDLQMLINGKSLGYASLGHIRKVMHGIFELAVEDDLIQKNPCRKLALPMDRRKPRQRSTANVEALRGYLERSKGTDVYAFLLLLCLGLRKGEALGVRKSDYSGGFLHVNRQRKGDPVKTRASYRSIPVPEWFRPVVKVSESTVIRKLRGLHGKTNLPSGDPILPKGVTIHSIRAAVKSGMGRMGARQAVTAAILGHSRGTLEEAYDHTFEPEVREWVEKWLDLLAGDTSVYSDVDNSCHPMG